MSATKTGVFAEIMTRIKPAATISHMVIQAGRMTGNIPRAALTNSMLKVRLRFIRVVPSTIREKIDLRKHFIDTVNITEDVSIGNEHADEIAHHNRRLIVPG